MGCVQSQNDINDLHPNIFRVINVDEGGVPSGSGQLEVTETALVLHRKNKEPTIWPLKSLRRYGFDADLFSFESGRRCDTGQGIYAFKCRRAEALYHTLQSFIQVRNTIGPEEAHNTSDYPVPTASNGPAVAARNFGVQNNIRISTSPISNRNSLLSDVNMINETNQDGNYLDPMPLVRQMNQGLNDIPGTGPLSPEAVSPGSPISNNILEVTSLNPLPSSTSHGVSNVYQLQDFSQRESNNNKKFAFLHSYTNSSTINETPQVTPNINLLSNTTEAITVDTMKNIINKQPSPQKSKNIIASAQAAYMNIDPSLGNLTDGDSELNRLYMNVAPNDLHNINSPLCSIPNGFATISHLQRMSLPLSVSTAPLLEDKHCYENLEVTDLKNDSHQSPIKDNSNSVSVPQTPTNGTREVNYIELDLENTKSEAKTEGVQCSSMQNLLPPESPRKPTAGYATIDFNKTVALSNSATPCLELDSEGSRKTRHNSTVALGRNSNSISD